MQSLTERYLSPEPLLQSPAYVASMAQQGMAVPTYGYANNPLRYVDPDGLRVTSDINRLDYWERFTDAKVRLMSCSAIADWFKNCFGTDPFTNSTEYTFIYDRSADIEQSGSTNWWTNNTTLGRSAFSPERWSSDGNAELAATILHELAHHLRPIRTNDVIEYLGGQGPQGECSARAAERVARQLWKKGCNQMCSGGP